VRSLARTGRWVSLANPMATRREEIDVHTAGGVAHAWTYRGGELHGGACRSSPPRSTRTGSVPRRRSMQASAGAPEQTVQVMSGT
jgi:hypothetical protein